MYWAIAIAVVVLIAVYWFFIRTTPDQDGLSLPPTDTLPPHYKTDKVGNDAAANPWEHDSLVTMFADSVQVEAVVGRKKTPINNGLQQQLQSIEPAESLASLPFRPDQLPDRLPATFDLETCLKVSKTNFERMHRAWESGDFEQLAPMLSPSIKLEVEEAMSAGRLSGWGQASGDIQHLTARVLAATPLMSQGGPTGATSVLVEYGGSQVTGSDGQTQPIRETWQILYNPQSGLWQITDLKAHA